MVDHGYIYQWSDPSTQLTWFKAFTISVGGVGYYTSISLKMLVFGEGVNTANPAKIVQNKTRSPRVPFVVNINSYVRHVRELYSLWSLWNMYWPVFMTLHKFPMIKYTDLKFRTWEVSQTSSNMAWNIASEQKITNNLVTERKHTSILRIPWGRNDITASLNSNIASISFP